MYLIRLPKRRFFDAETGLQLIDPVAVVQAIAVITPEEHEQILKQNLSLWRYLCQANGVSGFGGHIRYDLVPGLTGQSEKRQSSSGVVYYNMSRLENRGLYEINGHGEESLAAMLALLKVNLQFLKYYADLVSAYVRRLQSVFGQEEVAIVVGLGALKQHWGDNMINYLKNAGLNLRRISFLEAMAEEPDNLWCWADVRENGHSDVPQWFADWFLAYRFRSDKVVFNSRPSVDLFSKEYLLDVPEELEPFVGKNTWLNKSTLLQALLKAGQYVIKPVNGSSGEGVACGRFSRYWRLKVLQAAKQGGFGLFEARYLPVCELEGLGRFVLDMNYAYMADGEELNFLYPVSRINTEERYLSHGTNNVSQGAGIIGATVVGDLDKVVQEIKNI